MKSLNEQALELHEKYRGKVGMHCKMEVNDAHDLSLVYSPGVAAPCLEIVKDKANARKYTSKGNTVIIVSDGSAVLGLGDIGPLAALPVMEGKSMLLKKFAGIDSFPICIDTKDVDEFVNIVSKIALNFGGINLEDISAPRCVEIEEKLKQLVDIPLFHDDQHGTAIVTLAALINALKLVNKSVDGLKVVVNGLGAAGSAVTKILGEYGIRNIHAFNKDGVVTPSNYPKDDLAITRTIPFLADTNLTLEQALVGADVFIGLSISDCVTFEMAQSMNKDAIIFAMANPNPEINYDLAKQAGVRVMGTGRSDYPNQVNNVLAFPGIFKGALVGNATQITEKMKLAAAIAIAGLIDEKDLTDEYIVPSAFDERVVDVVARAVIEAI